MNTNTKYIVYGDKQQGFLVYKNNEIVNVSLADTKEKAIKEFEYLEEFLKNRRNFLTKLK